MKITWEETTEMVYNVIWIQHHKKLQVFETFTNNESNERFGSPHIFTEWGFNGSDVPLMKSSRKKYSDDQEEWDHRYYLAVPFEETRRRKQMRNDWLADWAARLILVPVLVVMLPAMGLVWLIFKALAKMEKGVGNVDDRK
jgi:hypothetical protein